MALDLDDMWLHHQQAARIMKATKR